MSHPSFYPGSPVEVQVRETQISWVFLAGSRAYKLKKPVVLPFLDYGSAPRRRRFCEEEIRLNRRLAPTVYRGVRSIVHRDGRFALSDPEDPEAVDYVVEMVRYADDETLAAAVAGARAGVAEAERIGRVLAAFHRHAPVRTHERDELARVERVLHGNFEAIIPWAHVLGAERVSAAQRFAHAFLAARAAGIVARARKGQVREGHGDLRAEHILLRDGAVEIVDCLEFDRDLRELDVGADLSFLVMDLTRLGVPELGWEIVRSYRKAGGDPGPNAHIMFHAANRAWVRTKLACLRADEPERTEAERAVALAEAQSMFEVGERLSWLARLPLVICVCGVPASGKTQLATALADRGGLPVVGSDRTRKGLFGLELTDRAPLAAYDDAVSRTTYETLGASAAALVHERGGAIVDATFRHAADRAAFRRALGRPTAPVLYVECIAPDDVLAARARAREESLSRADASDAGPELVDRLSHDWEPLADVSPGRHLIVRTDRVVEDAVDDVVSMLDRRLDGAAPPEDAR